MLEEQPPSSSEHREYVPDAAPWPTWLRRLVVVGIIALVLVGLSLAGPIYGQVILAIVVCVFLFLPVRMLLNRTRLPYGIAVGLIFTAYLLLVLLLVSLLAAPVVRFASELVITLSRELAETVEFLYNYTPGDAVLLDAFGNPVLDLDFVFGPLSQAVQERPAEELANLIPALVGIVAGSIGLAGSLAGFAYNFFFVHLLALLFLLEVPNLYRWLLITMSPPSRRQLGVLLARFGATWTSYLWGTAAISLIGAVLTWGLLVILGIPNAIGIAIVTTIVLLIPLFGTVIGTIVCFLAAISGGSSVLTLDPLGVGLVTAAAFFFMRGPIVGNLVYPRIVGRSVNVPAVFVIIALSFFGTLAGLLGMFLSPILVAVVRDLGIFTFQKLDGREPFPKEPHPTFMYVDHFTKRRSRHAYQPAPE